jgi:hypothetical protein
MKHLKTQEAKCICAYNVLIRILPSIYGVEVVDKCHLNSKRCSFNMLKLRHFVNVKKKKKKKKKKIQVVF